VTAQIQDRVIFQDIKYEIIGVNGTGLFQPSDKGLRVAELSDVSDCYRGFHCTYMMEDDRLYLTTLFLLSDDEPEPLSGVAPHRRMTEVQIPRWFRKPIIKEEPEFMFRYEGLRHAVAFKGRLLIGCDFIQDLFVHMGFQPVWAYRKVLECSFKTGVATEIEDRSQLLEDLRERISREPSFVDPKNRDQVAAWIEQSFDLTYGPLE